jgi:hypothetical protein
MDERDVKEEGKDRKRQKRKAWRIGEKNVNFCVRHQESESPEDK